LLMRSRSICRAVWLSPITRSFSSFFSRSSSLTGMMTTPAYDASPLNLVDWHWIIWYCFSNQFSHLVEPI